MIWATVLVGTFAESRKAPISLITSVRPSVRMYQHGSHRTDFRAISYSEFYENLTRNSKFGSNQANVSGTSMQTEVNFTIAGYN